MTNEQTGRTVISFSPATRNILAGAALLLPSLSLLPLGGLYLWEHSLLLWWAGGSLLIVALITFSLRYALRPATRIQPVPAVTVEPGADPHWSDLEVAAWKDVLAIAARVDVNDITSTDYFLGLGQTTLNAVAQRLHPEKTDALWRFTLPEALAIVERVSRRLGTFVVDAVPLGDTLTVAQLLAAYRWRGVFDVAERAYDIWRILRIVNPATAVTNEARERLSRAVYNYGKEHVSRRIAEAYVEEVGRAAIDLYGGRLMIAQKLQNTAPSGADDPLRELASRHVSVNVVVGGGVRRDRLALASMLSDAADAQLLSARTAAEGVLTTLSEPLALRAEATDESAVSEELLSADVLVWLVMPEKGAEDARALAAFAAQSRSRGHTTPPLFLPVGLYDTDQQASGAKPVAAAAAEALAIALDARPVPLVAIVGLDLDPRNSMQPLLKALSERLMLARRSHILRVLGVARRTSSWTQSARQAVKAAGMLTRAVVRRRQN